MIESHPFKAFVPENPKVLILGSFPGKEQTQGNTSEADQWYYGAKRNQFWKIVSSVYDIELKSKEQKMSLFSQKKIAIADILKKIRRKDNGNLDSNLEIIEYNKDEILDLLETFMFDRILFTSKFVQHHFLKLFPDVKNIEYLPSPSPRYARITRAEKINIYRSLLPQ